MASKVLSCYMNLSYLKRRKLSSNTWKLLSKRYLCSSSNEDDSSTKEQSFKIDSSKSMDKKEKKRKMKIVPVSETEQDNKQSHAKEKLLSLLSGFEVRNSLSETKRNLNLAKPLQRINKPKIAAETVKKGDLKLEDQIKSAVKNIVSSAATDEPEKMEAELLKGVSLVSPTSDDPIVTEPKSDTTAVDEEVKENIMHAVEVMASTVVENPILVHSELTKKLLAVASQKQSEFKASDKERLNDLFEGMKIERTEPSERQSPQREFLEKEHYPFREQPYMPRDKPKHFRARSEFLSKADLFAAAPLNIFVEPAEMEDAKKLILWEKLNKNELSSLIQFAPTNPYEEMIQLTEQGKHWKLPVNNEIDMIEEENVSFHEHVFLDHLLEGFPKKGPIRHFMELITIGLSKNPYITVERKIENIEWFRNYFEEKRDILEHYNCL